MYTDRIAIHTKISISDHGNLLKFADPEWQNGKIGRHDGLNTAIHNVLIVANMKNNDFIPYEGEY